MTSVTKNLQAKKDSKIKKHEQAAKKMFGKEAERQEKKYKEKGLTSTAKLIVDLIASQESIKDGIHVDVGCGSGVVCVELLKKGASKTIGVDLSEDAIARATALADELQLSDRATFVAGSFIEIELRVEEPVQSVILHRVLCCHPNAKGILEKTTSLNPRDIYITLPTDNSIVIGIHAPIGVLTRIFTKGFQAQFHRHQMMMSYLEERGYKLQFRSRKFPWITFHFTKRMA